MIVWWDLSSPEFNLVWDGLSAEFVKLLNVIYYVIKFLSFSCQGPLNWQFLTPDPHLIWSDQNSHSFCHCVTEGWINSEIYYTHFCWGPPENPIRTHGGSHTTLKATALEMTKQSALTPFICSDCAINTYSSWKKSFSFVWCVLSLVLQGRHWCPFPLLQTRC